MTEQRPAANLENLDQELNDLNPTDISDSSADIISDRVGSSELGATPANPVEEAVAQLGEENNRLAEENNRLRDRLNKLEERIAHIESVAVTSTLGKTLERQSDGVVPVSVRHKPAPSDRDIILDESLDAQGEHAGYVNYDESSRLKDHWNKAGDGDIDEAYQQAMQRRAEEDARVKNEVLSSDAKLRQVEVRNQRINELQQKLVNSAEGSDERLQIESDIAELRFKNTEALEWYENLGGDAPEKKVAAALFAASFEEYSPTESNDLNSAPDSGDNKSQPSLNNEPKSGDAPESDDTPTLTETKTPEQIKQDLEDKQADLQKKQSSIGEDLEKNGIVYKNGEYQGINGADLPDTAEAKTIIREHKIATSESALNQNELNILNNEGNKDAIEDLQISSAREEIALLENLKSKQADGALSDDEQLRLDQLESKAGDRDSLVEIGDQKDRIAEREEMLKQRQVWDDEKNEYVRVNPNTYLGSKAFEDARNQIASDKKELGETRKNFELRKSGQEQNVEGEAAVNNEVIDKAKIEIDRLESSKVKLGQEGWIDPKDGIHYEKDSDKVKGIIEELTLRQEEQKNIITEAEANNVSAEQDESSHETAESSPDTGLDGQPPRDGSNVEIGGNDRDRDPKEIVYDEALNQYAALKAKGFWAKLHHEGDYKEDLSAAKEKFNKAALELGKVIVDGAGEDEDARNEAFLNFQTQAWESVRTKVAEIKGETKYGRVVNALGKMSVGKRLATLGTAGLVASTTAKVLLPAVGVTAIAAPVATVGAGLFVAYRIARAKLSVDISHSESNKNREKGFSDKFLAFVSLPLTWPLARLSGWREQKMEEKYGEKLALGDQEINDRKDLFDEEKSTQKAQLRAELNDERDAERKRRSMGQAAVTMVIATIAGATVGSLAADAIADAIAEHMGGGSVAESTVDLPGGDDNHSEIGDNPDPEPEGYEHPDNKNVLGFDSELPDVDYGEYLAAQGDRPWAMGLEVDTSSSEAAVNEIIEYGNDMPEHTAQLVKATLTDEQINELGFGDLSDNEIANMLHNDELRAHVMSIIEVSGSHAELVDGIDGTFYNWGARPVYDSNGTLVDTELVQSEIELHNATLIRFINADGDVSYFNPACKNFLTEQPTPEIAIATPPPSTGEETPPPEITTPPPEITTPPPEITTPPPEITTPPPEITTPPPEITTPPPTDEKDYSNHPDTTEGLNPDDTDYNSGTDDTPNSQGSDNGTESSSVDNDDIDNPGDETDIPAEDTVENEPDFTPPPVEDGANGDTGINDTEQGAADREATEQAQTVQDQANEDGVSIKEEISAPGAVEEAVDDIQEQIDPETGRPL